MRKILFTIAIGFFSLTIQAQTIFNLTYTHDLPAGQATVLIDLNGDSLLDFITANKQVIGVVQNLGNGQFTQLTTFPSSSSNGFGSYDLNGDGMLDFTIAQDDGQPINDNMINNGNSTFTSVNSGNESVGATRNVVYADIDNDGFVDSYHSASAFGSSRDGNQLHKGLTNGQFGPDIMEQVLPGFYYDSLVHPTLGPQYWSSKQSKGVVIRDLDNDGKADIINAVYCDLGFQPDTFTQLWVNEQERGLFILKNTSTTGAISLQDVSTTALGATSHGVDSTFWNAYSPVPIDYDNDGDYDLIVGATTRMQENTDLIRLYENISTPGNIQFVEKTIQAGFQFVNNQSVAIKKKLNFAAGVPLDYDNDGWVDIAFVNRRDGNNTFAPYVQLFKNNGNGTFTQVAYAAHGVGLTSGGRDINVGDLNNDGKLDIILSDGTAGGYEGTDSTLVYINNSTNTNNWVQLDIKTNPAGTWAFDHTVKIYKHGTTQLLGMDDIRTDFCYRAKRYPILHFGLGSIDSIDVVIAHNGTIYQVNGLPVEELHSIYLNQITGLNDKEKEMKIKIYPNPANKTLFINSDTISSLHYQITNFIGQIIIQASTNGNSIDVSSLQKGIYFIQLKDEKGKLFTTKFIKE